MKKAFKKLLVGMVAVGILSGNTTAVFAEETVDYDETAKQMIEMYDESESDKEVVSDSDERFVNEMVLEQEEKKEKLESIYEEAEENNEKFYTNKEILEGSAEEFDMSKEDYEYIRGVVYTHYTELKNTLEALDDLGEENHEVAKRIDEELNKKVPASQLYVDKSAEPQDGIISGGGWPYCLDDNGYGYKNFITSDCYKAIVGYLICASDSTLGKMSSSMRYCKAHKKNCSGLIGHSKYWHTHKWYGKIP